MLDFKLKTDYIPLCDLLKISGLCGTGGQAKIMISQGLVKVDGIVELKKRCKITKNQIVEYDNETIQVK